MRRAVQFYQDIADRFPKLVNGTTGFLIAGVGDYLCQRHFEYPRRLQDHGMVECSTNISAPNQIIVHKDLLEYPESKTDQVPSEVLNFEWDKKRTLDMSLIRAFVITPFVMKWYQILPKISPGLSLKSVLVRILLDQLIGSPTVISLVFVASAILKGDVWKCLDTFRFQFADTYFAGMGYWPFVHTINFRFVPLKHQPLFAHFASVYWNAVLSYYSNKNELVPLAGENGIDQI